MRKAYLHQILGVVMMTSKHYEEFMKMAIEEAKTSLKEGNKGFGAVVAKDGRVIASAHDTEVTDQDSIAHAEINVIRRASKIYNNDIRKLVRKFRTTKKSDWTIIEEDLLNKRMQWFENNKTMICKLKGNDLEKAYHLILMKIGIKSSEAPIVEKSENKIIFRSKNYCPSLEACIILDLDTREVCKEVYERPTEELIRRLNPQLRFTRNYECIRPYSDYCEEIITLEK